MLVAFNMFAGRVAQPIMRIAQMWTDFQQTGLSMERLGDILNTRTELPPQSVSPLPRLQGRVTLDNLTFRYRPDAPPVLHGVSLDVRPGEVIGIVGRSGSGKSTLTKLIQRLYVPESGRVQVDGHDIALIDAAQLRRQVGVVLQENMLFNRSVRENIAIAIADPAAPLEAVIHAAKLAGAHEFITELPQGYDTVVGEQGSSLFGGQRQRIAIARALFSQPRILIFDEATSALDYESEAIIQHNMRAICQGRTVFIIAHRLSAVRNAHRIIAMDKGRIVEVGTHALAMWCPSISEGIIRSGEQLLMLRARAPEMLKDLQDGDRLERMAATLKKGAPLAYEPEHIENFNSLQIPNAERYVFANGEHFDLARRMLSAHPHLSKGPRVKA